MQVTGENGVVVTNGGGTTLVLDPKRTTPGSVVTHAHADHLTPDAHMTPPTLDFLKIRKPRRSGLSLPYGRETEIGGFRVTLHDAGHVFGSAMVHASGGDGSLLYTGDFNPRASLTESPAKPVACDILVTESTYGDPRFDLPPRELVLASIESWMLSRLLRGPVAMGAHPLGRAQELVLLANRAGIVPIVSPDIAELTAVYNAHGHDLRYAVAGSERARSLDAPGTGALHLVPREWLKRDHDFARGLLARGGAGAYLSGWCHRYSYFQGYAIDAQFTLSDHASFHDLVTFAMACKPKRVLTTHGSSVALAHELRKRGLHADPL